MQNAEIPQETVIDISLDVDMYSCGHRLVLRQRSDFGLRAA